MTLPDAPPAELVEIAARAGNGEIFWNEEDPLDQQEWRELLLAEARCTLTAVWPALQALVSQHDEMERDLREGIVAAIRFHKISEVGGRSEFNRGMEYAARVAEGGGVK